MSQIGDGAGAAVSAMAGAPWNGPERETTGIDSAYNRAALLRCRDARLTLFGGISKQFWVLALNAMQ